MNDYFKSNTRSKIKMVGALALTVATMGSGAFAAEQPEQSQASPSGSEPVAATLKYVDKAKLPFAKAVIEAFRHTKPSRRHVKRHTSAFFPSSYQNVTQILATIPAKAAFGNGRVAGAYDFGADFRGAIKPKNVVLAGVSATPDIRNPANGYSFLLARTTHDGPTTVMPMHWFMSTEYARGSKGARHNYDSCSATGSTGGDSSILTAPILAIGMRQAIKVLRQAVHHRPIRWQKDVLASKQPARFC